MNQVLKTELIYNRYSVMSISSVQTYNIVTTDIVTDTIVKNVYLENTEALYNYYKNEANTLERKVLKKIADSYLRNNLSV
jgi:glutaminase